MKILAIETSCDVASVSLLEDNKLIKELKNQAVKNHSETLMPLIDELLKTTNTTIHDIDLFACDNGPGSFTGIRIGLSTVKAFCDVTNKQCSCVSSLEALAYTNIADDNSIICSMIDAKHDNVYAGLFEKKGENLVKLNEFVFSNINDFLKNLSSLKKKIFFVGNCGILYKDMIQSYLKNEIYFEDDLVPSSKYIGIAAFDKFKAGNIFNSFDISALYLKRTSAEENKKL